MNRLHDILLEWYALNARELPWRRTRDPYAIWISEAILQQTRVAQGLAYYERFMERFPDPATLSAASQQEVLKLWQGLGYYSRARNLHAAARRIVEEHGGRFPRRYDQVRALPGIGDYTAAAVCSFAYDDPLPVVDGNVYRLLGRLFDIDLPIDSAAGRKAFAELAREVLDTRNPALWNQAVMEFGALRCTPARPLCTDCPLGDRCLARAAGSVGERPVKRGRTSVRPRWFNYLHICFDGRTLLRRRTARDIWQGLYEFPSIETPRPVSFGELSATEPLRTLVRTCRLTLEQTTPLPEHRLSHQSIHGVVHRLRAGSTEAFDPAWIVVAEDDPGDYPVPRLIERYLLG